MIQFPKFYADQVARLRVPSGFLLLAMFAWFARPDQQSLFWGVPVSLLGLALRAWAAGHLAKNERLATGGPYAWIRNPLYIGTLSVAAGLVISARQPWLAVLFGAVFAFVYLPVIQLEEQHLRKIFPEYRTYAERVPALIPRGRRLPSSEPFRLSLYIRNQEYQALAGFAIGLAFLMWRS